MEKSDPSEDQPALRDPDPADSYRCRCSTNSTFHCQKMLHRHKSPASLPQAPDACMSNAEAFLHCPYGQKHISRSAHSAHAALFGEVENYQKMIPAEKSDDGPLELQPQD